MKKLSLALAALALLAIPSRALAGPIPYPTVGGVGVENTEVYNFTAGFDGDIWGYFIGGDAGYGSRTNMSVAGGAYNPPDPGAFQNHQPNLDPVLFASGVSAGDSIHLKLNVSVGNPDGPEPTTYSLYSDPTLNPFGINHIYATAYTGSVGGCDAPGAVCTYVGWEDIRFTGGDFDYNDHQFVFKGVGRSVPDGGSALAFLGVALTGLGVLRRRLS